MPIVNIETTATTDLTVRCQTCGEELHIAKVQTNQQDKTMAVYVDLVEHECLTENTTKL